MSDKLTSISRARQYCRLGPWLPCRAPVERTLPRGEDGTGAGAQRPPAARPARNKIKRDAGGAAGGGTRAPYEGALGVDQVASPPPRAKTANDIIPRYRMRRACLREGTGRPRPAFRIKRTLCQQARGAAVETPCQRPIDWKLRSRSAGGPFLRTGRS